MTAPEYAASPEPRWGHGKPPHRGLLRLLEARRQDYQRMLELVMESADDLAAIPVEDAAGGQARWRNTWFSGLDAAALYTVIGAMRPRRYIEVGSGHSTMFARRAIQDQGLATVVTAVDPAPRADVAAIADRCIQSPLADVDLSLFDQLESDDIFFLDGSHQATSNSDATVAFLEVMPLLTPGVLVHVHDVFLPDDYPADWAERRFSEQFVLAAELLAGAAWEILLPNYFVSGVPQLAAIVSPLWDRLGLEGWHRSGSSFWMRRA